MKEKFIFIITSSIVFLLGFWIVNAVWQNTSTGGNDTDLYTSGEDYLTAVKWNSLVQDVQQAKAKINLAESNANDISSTADAVETKANDTVTLVSNIGLLSNTIAAFNLTTCPSGWSPADGTNGNPDLRGQFLRGLNTFDEGTTTRSDGYQDPNSRTLGNYQSDDNKGHTHSLTLYANTSSGSGGFYRNAYSYTNTRTTSESGGNENRPKNISFIFCVKD